MLGALERITNTELEVGMSELVVGFALLQYGSVRIYESPRAESDGALSPSPASCTHRWSIGRICSTGLTPSRTCS